MSEGTSSGQQLNLFPDKDKPLPNLTTEQLDKLFSTEFVPSFTPSSASSKAVAAAAAAAPEGEDDEVVKDEVDDEEEQDEAEAVVHDPEWYEHLGGHDEAALSSAGDVMDAVKDWEENTPLDELPDSSKVCTFWVRNKCRVVNCPFLHQYYGVRCHHFQDLGCIMGDECPYVHTTVADQRLRWELMGMELVPPPIESFIDVSAPQQVVPSKADFPALGATPAQQQQEALAEEEEQEDEEQDDPELGADVHVETAAERLSFLELRRMFSWVPRAVVETIFIQWFALFQSSTRTNTRTQATTTTNTQREEDGASKAVPQDCVPAAAGEAVPCGACKAEARAAQGGAWQQHRRRARARAAGCRRCWAQR